MLKVVIFVACLSLLLTFCVGQDFFGTTNGWLYGKRDETDSPLAPDKWIQNTGFQCATLEGDVSKVQAPFGLSSKFYNHSLHCLHPLFGFNSIGSFDLFNTKQALSIKPIPADRLKYTMSRIPTAMEKSVKDNMNCTSKNYILERLDFKLSQNDTIGSEHHIDGEYGVMETQMVFYDSKFDSYGAAAASSDKNARVIMCSLYHYSDTPGAVDVDPRYWWNPTMSQIYEQIKDTGVSVTSPKELKNANLLTFIPTQRNQKNYFLYDATNNHPPCTENVRYIVFKGFLHIERKHLQSLRQLKTGDSVQPDVFPNLRPVQIDLHNPENDRSNINFYNVGNKKTTFDRQKIYIYQNGNLTDKSYSNLMWFGLGIGIMLILLLVTIEFYFTYQYYTKKNQ